jgi:hypothetical protein
MNETAIMDATAAHSAVSSTLESTTWPTTAGMIASAPTVAGRMSHTGSEM